MGEINASDRFGQAIIKTVKDFSLQNILEIGSWDGTGSTQCFIEALKYCPKPRLTCLEVHVDRFADLKRNVALYPWVLPFNESSISLKSFLHPTFESVWNSPYNRINSTPEIVSGWYAQDYERLKNTQIGFLERTHELYDGVLIDGSEFTGYSEFQLLKNRTNVFFLDDYYNAFKTRQVAAELAKDPEWQIIDGDRFCRQGFAILARKKFSVVF
jgi:hypothetical protein